MVNSRRVPWMRDSKWYWVDDSGRHMNRLPGRVIGVVLLLATGPTACGSDSAAPIPVGPPAYIGLDGENNQVVRRNEISLPFRVRVVDDAKRGVPDVRIRWSRTSIEGTFLGVDDQPVPDDVTVTDRTGISQAVFRIGENVGTGQVQATAEGLTTSVTFLVTVVHEHDVFVTFGPLFDCNEPFFFYGSNGSNRVEVQLGGTVHFKYADASLHHSCRAIIASFSEPPGGNSFTSDSLTPTDTFRFKPNVAGTWELTELINGGRGTLTARP